MSILITLVNFALSNEFLVEVILITLLLALIMRYTKTIIYTVISLFTIGYFMVDLKQIPYWLYIEDIVIFTVLYFYKKVKLKI